METFKKCLDKDKQTQDCNSRDSRYVTGSTLGRHFSDNASTGCQSRSMKIYDRVRWNDQRKGLSNHYDCMTKLIMLERIKVVITQAQPNTKPSLKKVECE